MNVVTVGGIEVTAVVGIAVVDSVNETKKVKYVFVDIMYILLIHLMYLIH